LGQPATELSGGEAQRVKLATELQRVQRGQTLYVLDEPTTGLHPSDVERLQRQLQNLVNAGNTVVVIEHDMQIIADSDWIIDVGPGAGDEGGHIVVAGSPVIVARDKTSKNSTIHCSSAVTRRVCDEGDFGFAPTSRGQECHRNVCGLMSSGD
jgi:excinuclease ABC subunit A